MSSGQIIIGLVLIAIGVSSFTDFDIFRYSCTRPVYFLRLRILLGKSWGRKKYSASQLVQDDINEVAIFSASRKTCFIQRITGGKAASIFSEWNWILRRQRLKESGRILSWLQYSGA